MPSSAHPNPVIDPGTIQTTINNTLSQYTNLPPSAATFMNTVAGIESSYDLNVGNSSTGAVGVMQVTPKTARDLAAQNLYSGGTLYDLNNNVEASAALTNQLYKAYNGDQEKMAAGYYAGQTKTDAAIAAAKAAGTPDAWPDYLEKTQPGSIDYLNKYNASSGNQNYVSGQAAGTSQSPDINKNNPGLKDPNPDPIQYSALPYQNVTQEAFGAANAGATDMIVKEGLDAKPWYQDTNVVTGNPRLQKNGNFPVTFEVFMDRDSSSSALKNGNQPIIIPLNCSLSRYSLTSRHIVNKQDTRTGFFVTLWGMAADVLTGEGSTGVFMNQFGLTDFLSLSDITTEAYAAVFGAFALSPSSTTLSVAQTEGVGGAPAGNLSVKVVPKTPILSQLQQANRAQGINNNALAFNAGYDTEPFRIAAQDAFIEFLSLFKMNGTTYLNPSGYNFSNQSNSSTDNVNVNNTALSLYSPTVGASSAEIKGRNNDVFRRGYVVMRFRNSQYLGYFKSLNWQMDANNPYQWKFNFVFQVERTLTVAYFPYQTTKFEGANAPPIPPASNATQVPTPPDIGTPNPSLPPSLGSPPPPPPPPGL